MKVSLEHLYHFCCDHCAKWWTFGDIKPQIGIVLHCPHCGKENTVEEITAYEAYQIS